VEVLLASGVVYALGDLFHLAPDPLYRAAARRIIQQLMASLADPYGDPAAAAIAYYRLAFQDEELDAALLRAVQAFPPEEEGELAMVVPEVCGRTQPGVGRRADMVYWGVWEGEGRVRPTREPSTAALALAYQLTSQTEFARRAFRAAAGRLAVARRVLRGGREHADMGGAICSVAQGHGRNWGVGAVTGCYGPLCLGTREILGAVTPAVPLRCPGAAGLPASILPLVGWPRSSQPVVHVYNAGSEPACVEWPGGIVQLEPGGICPLLGRERGGNGNGTVAPAQGVS
jgi:hypothetical protein